MDSLPVGCYLAGLVVFLCLLYVWSRRRFYALSAQLPGPFALPFVGNGAAFFCKPEELLNRMLKLTTPYQSPTRLWLGPQLVIVVHDPDQLQIVMQSQKMATKCFIYKYLEPFMGKGLFTSSGLQHKTQKKLLQPLFGPKMVEGYSYLFQKHAKKFVEVLESHVEKDPFDVLILLHDYAFGATMDILVEIRNDYFADFKYIPEYVRRFYHIFSQRVVSFWMYPECLYRLTNFYKEQEMMATVVKALTEEVKDARIPEILEKFETKANENTCDEVRVPSMLEMMVEMVIEKPDCLNETEFKDHMLTLVAASQDTQSSTIAFTLMMLGMHKDIQAKVVEELKEVIGDRECVDYGDTGKLKYMEMCIKESMRLFPVGPFLPRDVAEDFQLGKWLLPAGCSVVLGIYHVHRNPLYWEKPEEYYPEHFTIEAASKRHPYAYIPFSAGPRKCVAQQYSYINMKILIGTFLRNYVVECSGTLKDLELMTDVSIRPIHGHNISIKRRKYI